MQFHLKWHHFLELLLHFLNAVRSTHKLSCHLYASLLRNTAETIVQEKKTTDSCNNMQSGIYITESHIKKQMNERKCIVVCLMSCLIIPHHVPLFVSKTVWLEVEAVLAGGVSDSWGILGLPWFPKRDTTGMQAQDDTATTLPTITFLHLPSYWNLPKLWPHQWQHCKRFHLCHKWHVSDYKCHHRTVPTYQVEQIMCM